jgi:hypothetical protein
VAALLVPSLSSRTLAPTACPALGLKLGLRAEVERGCLGVVLAEELRGLGRAFGKSGLLEDRRGLRVRGEASPAGLVPVEDRPDPVAVIWIPEDVRPLAAVLLSLFSALG